MPKHCGKEMREVSSREVPSLVIGVYTFTLYQCDECKRIEEH